MTDIAVCPDKRGRNVQSYLDQNACIIAVELWSAFASDKSIKQSMHSPRLQAWEQHWACFICIFFNTHSNWGKYLLYSIFSRVPNFTEAVFSNKSKFAKLGSYRISCRSLDYMILSLTKSRNNYKKVTNRHIDIIYFLLNASYIETEHNLLTSVYIYVQYLFIIFNCLYMFKLVVDPV